MSDDLHPEERDLLERLRDYQLARVSNHSAAGHIQWKQAELAERLGWAEITEVEGGRLISITTAGLAALKDDATAEDVAECDAVLTIDQGGDHWVIKCLQGAGHVSPHASAIVWPNELVSP